jgi:hypothetical protein
LIVARIELLLVEAKAWLETHRRAGRQIEATACRIRIRALEDALWAAGLD